MIAADVMIIRLNHVVIFGKFSCKMRWSDRPVPRTRACNDFAVVALASWGCCAMMVFLSDRSVAQPGRALGLGPRRRRFKSCRSDHFLEGLISTNPACFCAVKQRLRQRFSTDSGSTSELREPSLSFSIRSMRICSLYFVGLRLPSDRPS